jgi:hypothetical protein
VVRYTAFTLLLLERSQSECHYYGEKMSGSLQVSEQSNLLGKRNALGLFSILFYVSLVAAFSVAGSDEPNPNVGLVLLCLSLVVGIYILFATVEISLAKHLVDMKATVIFWVTIIGLLGYIGKLRAGDDINSIFHQDASLFPQTNIAATLLHAFYLLLIPMACGIVLTGCAAWSNRKSMQNNGDSWLTFLAYISIIMTLVITSALVFGRAGDDQRRLQLIYRIAQSADFNSSFRCKGLDEKKQSVIFMDADKKRVLVAPKIEDHFSLFTENKATLLQGVSIPTEFPILDCQYAAPEPEQPAIRFQFK